MSEPIDIEVELQVEIVRQVSGKIDVFIKGYPSLELKAHESAAQYRVVESGYSLVRVDGRPPQHSDKITVVDEAAIAECREESVAAMNEDLAQEEGARLVQVETPQGLQWYEKDDPVIPLFKRWSAGEIPTYVLDQEILALYQ